MYWIGIGSYNPYSIILRSISSGSVSTVTIDAKGFPGWRRINVNTMEETIKKSNMDVKIRFIICFKSYSPNKKGGAPRGDPPTIYFAGVVQLFIL